MLDTSSVYIYLKNKKNIHFIMYGRFGQCMFCASMACYHNYFSSFSEALSILCYDAVLPPIDATL